MRVIDVEKLLDQLVFRVCFLESEILRCREILEDVRESVKDTQSKFWQYYSSDSSD